MIRLQLYPITSLRRLKKHVLTELLANDVILCSELYAKRSLLMKLGMSEDEIDLLFSDIYQLTKKKI